MTLMPTFTSIQASSCCALLSSHQSLVPHSENHLLLFKSCSTASTRPAPELCEQLLGPHPSHPCCPVPQPAPKKPFPVPSVLPLHAAHQSSAPTPKLSHSKLHSPHGNICHHTNALCPPCTAHLNMSLTSNPLYSTSPISHLGKK